MILYHPCNVFLSNNLILFRYSEICSPGFNFQKKGKQPGTGHFTQLVWRGTRQLGIGLAVANRPSGDSCSYVVAR